MLQVIILVIQLTFSNGYLQPYPLPQGDYRIPRPVHEFEPLEL